MRENSWKFKPHSVIGGVIQKPDAQITCTPGKLRGIKAARESPKEKEKREMKHDGVVSSCT